MEIQLQNFISIFQLFAGVCLLFFYDDILKSVVVTLHRKRSIYLYDDIKNQLQIEFSDTDTSRLQELIDFHIDSNGSIMYLNLFRQAVGFMGKSACVFLLLLMFLACHESREYSPINYSIIFISDIFFLLVCFACGFDFYFRKKNWLFSGYWNFLWTATILCGICFASLSSNIWKICPEKFVIYTTLASFLTLTIWCVLLFIWEEKRVRSISEKLNNLRNAIVLYGAWSVNPNSGETYRNMSKSFKKLFGPNAMQTEAQTAVDSYIRNEFHNICKINPIWRDWKAKFRSFFCLSINIVKIYWTWLIVVIFVGICLKCI